MKNLYILFLFAVIGLGVCNAQIAYQTDDHGNQLLVMPASSPINETIFSQIDPLQSDDLQFVFDSLNVTYKGSWAFGQSFSIGCNSSGNIVFVGSGAGIILLDVSIPSMPVKLSEIHARGLIDAMYFDDFTSRLYLCTYFEGFEIWNLSNLTSPQLLGSAAIEGLPRGGIFASGQYVYVVSVANGVYVYDAANPAHPVLKGNCPIPGSNLVWNSSMVGNYIYLAVGNGGMKIIDVSNPVNPTIAGSSTYLTTGVYVEGNFAYTVAYNYGLRILDVTSPSAITQAGSVQLNGYPFRLKKIGNYVYIANSTSNPGGGIQVIDVSDPANPHEVFTYPGYADWIAGNGAVVAFTGGNNPCTILNISNPVEPVLASTYLLPISTIDVAVSGNYAYSASNGFRVYDISDKTHPTQIGYNENDGGLVEISGNVAIFIRESMTANNPVMIMDVSDPTNPVKAGQYMAPVMTNDIAVKDHYAFIACWWDGFRVIDFQNPASPVLVAHKFGWTGTSSVPGVDFCYVQGLHIVGNYLYLIDYQPFSGEDTKGLYIFDISDPTNPVKISRYPTTISSGYDITASGNFVYLADQNGGMEIIDVSDPVFPYTRSYISLPDVGWSIDYAENHVFVACYINGGVQVINVTDPDNPVIDGFYSRSGCFALGVRVNGNNIYLSDGAAGFQIYETQTITKAGGEVAIPDPINTYPNPFIDKVMIEIPATSQSDIELTIFDQYGRVVNTLINPQIPGNRQVFVWNGKNSNGKNVPNGVYYLSVNSGGSIIVKQVLKAN